MCDLFLLDSPEAAVPCWQASRSPCCGQCHESPTRSWRSHSAFPSCWPPCICSGDENHNPHMHYESGIYGLCSLKNVLLCKQKWSTYLWCEIAHRLGVEDLRSVLDSHVLAFCLFILVFVFHLKGGIINTLFRRSLPLERTEAPLVI